jgi:hypothetical protein
MIDLNIVGGTTVGNQSLCDSCENGVVFEGYKVSEKRTYCCLLYAHTAEIAFPVSKCSKYWKRGTARVHLDTVYLSSEALKVDPNNAGKNKKAGMAPEEGTDYERRG